MFAIVYLCNSLLKKGKRSFLKWLISGDEKCVLYNNLHGNYNGRSRDALYLKKIILCIWWDYNELLIMNRCHQIKQ